MLSCNSPKFQRNSFRSFLGNAVPSFIARLFVSSIQALCLPALEQEGRQLRGHVSLSRGFSGIFFILRFFEYEGVVCCDDVIERDFFQENTVAATLKPSRPCCNGFNRFSKIGNFFVHFVIHLSERRSPAPSTRFAPPVGRFLLRRTPPSVELNRSVVVSSFDPSSFFPHCPHFPRTWRRRRRCRRPRRSRISSRRWQSSLRRRSRRRISAAFSRRTRTTACTAACATCRTTRATFASRIRVRFRADPRARRRAQQQRRRAQQRQLARGRTFHQ